MGGNENDEIRWKCGRKDDVSKYWREAQSTSELFFRTRRMDD